MLDSVLVTGGAGYIGAHTCKALRRAGYTPVIYDNLDTGHRFNAQWGPLELGDIGDARRLHEVFEAHKPIAVLHFAAKSRVCESASAPNVYYNNNVGGSLVLIDACRQFGVRNLVFSSTCAVYGIPDRLPVLETSPCHPISPYGRSKHMVEEIFADACRAYGLNAIALRYFNAAGADEDGNTGELHDPETHLIPLVLMAAADPTRPVRIFGTDYPTPDGTCVRDYVHVSDLADAHVAALRHLLEGNGGAFEAINLGTGTGISVRQIIDCAAAITGRPILVKENPRRAGDPPVLVADPTTAHAILGWKTRVSDPHTMIESAWRWLNRTDPALGKRQAAAAAPIPPEMRNVAERAGLRA